MDDDRLKEPDNDYFEELLARIRDIRVSENPSDHLQIVVCRGTARFPSVRTSN